MSSKEVEKEMLIDKLIVSGIFKMGNSQLFELPLGDLQAEYEKIVTKEDSRRDD